MSRAGPFDRPGPSDWQCGGALLVAQRVVQHREGALRLRRQDKAGQQRRLGDPTPEEGRLEGLRLEKIAADERQHASRHQVRHTEERAPNLRQRTICELSATLCTILTLIG